MMMRMMIVLGMGEGEKRELNPMEKCCKITIFLQKPCALENISGA
jgi:hypothetical protein